RRMGACGAELLQRVLDLEQVGEVGVRLDPDREIRRLVAVAEDRELLVEAVTDRPLQEDRQLRVDVDGAGGRDEEEARLEVLEVIGREGVEPEVVDRQDPSREEPGVVREQPGRVGRRGLDVATLVADDERVAVQDPDEGRDHRQLLRLPTARSPETSGMPTGSGKSRINRTSMRGSPSRVSAPRR